MNDEEEYEPGLRDLILQLRDSLDSNYMRMQDDILELRKRLNVYESRMADLERQFAVLRETHIPF